MCMPTSNRSAANNNKSLPFCAPILHYLYAYHHTSPIRMLGSVSCHHKRPQFPTAVTTTKQPQQDNAQRSAL